MNRYQRELFEIDRRHRIAVRGVTLLGVAALVIVALWSAGLPPSMWFGRAQEFIARLRVTPAVQPSTVASPPPSVPATPVVSGNMALAGTDSSVSPTPLLLHLVSTVPGRNLREGTAALGVDPKNPQIYGAGALLVNGARLLEIHTDHVVLEKNGKSTRLYRERTVASERRQDSDLLHVGGAQPAPAPAPATVTREVLTDYLRPSPVYDGEMLQGFIVYPGVRSDVFSRLGLQSGDVITALNDVPLSDPAHAYELFRQLTAGIAMTATVHRKGKPERLTLDGAHIAADEERARNAAAGPAMPAGATPT